MGLCKEQEKLVSYCKIVKGSGRSGIEQDNGGRLSRSSEEVAERSSSEGLSWFMS